MPTNAAARTARIKRTSGKILAASLLVAPLHTAFHAPASARAATVVRHDRSDADVLDLGRRFPATVAFSADGTGTLIAPDWVLTAAHVAQGLSPFGEKIDVGGRTARVRRVFVHPGGVGERGRPPRVDLALVELDHAIDGVRPASPYTGRDEKGSDVVIAGAGDHARAGSPFQPADGRVPRRVK